MTIFLFDGTKEGLLSCIFDCYKLKKTPDVVSATPVQASLNDEIFEIKTDIEKAKRVEKFFHGCATKYVLHDVSLALRSGDSKKYTVVFYYLKLAIDNKNTDISRNYADKYVLGFADIIRKITNEVHRMKGMLRFSETVSGFLYAHYEPDNDVTELIIPHFFKRLGKSYPFMIHDTKRNIVGLSNGNETTVFNAGDRRIDVYLTREESEFIELWRTYYDSVNIKERKNLKLMGHYLPKKYWKNLPEKNRDL